MNVTNEIIMNLATPKNTSVDRVYLYSDIYYYFLFIAIFIIIIIGIFIYWSYYNNKKKV